MIAVERRGNVAILTLARMEKRNALDTAHCVDLWQAAQETADSGARCLVLQADGDTFCAGADFAVVMDPEFRRHLYELLHGLARLPIPVVAHVRGAAIGAGAQLAVAADLRVADRKARFGLPTARLGLAVDEWTIRRIAGLGGTGAVRLLLLGAGEIDAQRAHDVGLVDRLGGVDEALDWGHQIAALAPASLAHVKSALHLLYEDALPHPDITEAFSHCWASEDARAAHAAVLDGRRPTFGGRQ